MAYVQVEWVAGVTPLSEANMDHLETQYDEAKADLDAHVINIGAGDGRHRWTLDKLLKGQGAAAPIEIDVPSPTQEFWVPFHFGTGGAASAFGYDMGAGDTASLKFKVPHDFTALTSCYVIGIKFTNGTIDWTVVTLFGAAGELYDNHTDTDTANAVAFVNKEVCDIDIADALDGIAADDYVWLTFTLDAISAGTFATSGIMFKYS